MRAAVIHQHGGPDTIRIEPDFPDPEPGADDVVVKVGATTLNYHDIFTRRGMPGIKVPMPHPRLVALPRNENHRDSVKHRFGDDAVSRMA